MDLSFMKDHTAKPAYKIGEVIKVRITKVKPSETGFGVFASSPERSGVLHEHLYIDGESEEAKQIGRDTLALLMEQTGPVEKSEELAGKEMTVRVVAPSGSDLLGFSFNISTAQDNPY